MNEYPPEISTLAVWALKGATASRSSARTPPVRFIGPPLFPGTAGSTPNLLTRIQLPTPNALGVGRTTGRWELEVDEDSRGSERVVHPQFSNSRRHDRQRPLEVRSGQLRQRLD